MAGKKSQVAFAFGVLALVGVVLAGRGMAAQKKILDNGLTVILERDESVPTTVLQILIKGGARVEPATKRGLAFLTTRLAIEIPDSGKAQELISLATRFSITSQGDNSLINIECLSANLEPSLKVLSKIFLDPLFSGIRIDAVKKHMEHQGKVEEDDSLRLGHLAGLQAFFAGSGYGGSTYGDRASLEAIKNKDVSEFYKNTFVGPNIIMSFASDLPEDALLNLVGRYFARIPSGKPVVLDPVAASEPAEKTVNLERDTKQTFVSQSYRLPAISRRNFALASLLESLLGKGQGSRLWSLRAEKKLAYNVNCRATQMQEGGLIEAYLETDTAKQEIAREALRTVLEDLFRNGTTEEELLYAKNATKAGIVRDNETRAGRASSLAFFEASGLGLDFFDALFSEIDALTLEEVTSYIQEILAPEKALEVIVGKRSAE
jgi:predicted Zn-dependent peptidase